MENVQENEQENVQENLQENVQENVEEQRNNGNQTIRQEPGLWTQGSQNKCRVVALV